MIDRGLVGFAPFSALQPWYFLDSNQRFDVTSHWPNGPSTHPLLVFARRQDNDDMACFEWTGDRVGRVVLIHGWTESGYSIDSYFNTFWDWLKAVVDDIADWFRRGLGADESGS